MRETTESNGALVHRLVPVASPWQELVCQVQMQRSWCPLLELRLIHLAITSLQITRTTESNGALLHRLAPPAPPWQELVCQVQVQLSCTSLMQLRLIHLAITLLQMLETTESNDALQHRLAPLAPQWQELVCKVQVQRSCGPLVELRLIHLALTSLQMRETTESNDALLHRLAPLASPWLEPVVQIQRSS
jgi:hypothetical protein